MFPIPEQLSAATKAQFEAQSKIMNALTSQAFDNIEKIIALNISGTKAAIEKSSAFAHQLFAAQGSDKSTGARPAQPVLAAMLAYRHDVPDDVQDEAPSTAAVKPVAAEAVAAEKPTIKPPVATIKPVEVVAKPVAAAKPAAVVAKPAAAVKPVAKVEVVAAKPVAKVDVAVIKPVAAAKPAAAPFILPKKGAAPFPKSPVEK